MRRLLAVGLLAFALPSALAAQASAPAGRFAVADSLADAAPSAVESSIPALARYLAAAGTDDATRARALYRWVTGHIEYDVRALRAGRIGDVGPEAVLRSRLSVCEGYARLTAALGAAMGLEIQVVPGWSKGYGFAAGQRLDGPTNHAWNVVRIAGRWRLMDPTWGAGYLDEHARFVRRFQEHYFLTAPEAFVFDHLPEDPRWQLLERPVSAAEYADLVYLRPAFFVTGLRIGDHPGARLTADGRVTVTLGVTRPVQVTARVVDAATDRALEEDLTFVEAGAAEARIEAAFPRAGDYLLRVFAKPLGAAGAFDWALDYRVRASRGARDAAFPAAFGAFGARGVTLYEPRAGILEAGRSYRFRLRAPGAVELAVITGGRWTRLDAGRDEFAGLVNVSAGSVVVCAKYEAAAECTGLLRYRVGGR